MTIAFYCVLVASILPIIWVGFAKVKMGFNLKDNHTPRDLLENATGMAKRANWAQANSWEAFAPFAAAVIISHTCLVKQIYIDVAAITFIVARIFYGIFYIYDLAILRSLVWFIGFISTISMYYMSAII